ncbi:MAG: tRNA lysidine(34) synthetase TilS [Pseudomonadota bacterium]
MAQPPAQTAAPAGLQTAVPATVPAASPVASPAAFSTASPAPSRPFSPTAAPESADPAARLAAELPTQLLTQLAARLAPHLAAGQKLLVGLSGGLDSLVLLHLCVQLRSRWPADCSLAAVHVHHGLSPHADAWAEFCARRCAEWAVPLRIEKVKVQGRGEGLEAAARAARYRVFADCDADLLLLAQHRGDQAETLLFNLLRGAGVQGAAAMPPQRACGRAQLLRPLLDTPRAQLAAYAALQQLDWVEDESNADTRFSRNYLRHHILPTLSARFPAAEARLAAAAGHFAEAAALLAERAEEDLQACLNPPEQPDRLSLPALRTLSPARQHNLLRHWLARAGWRPPAAENLQEFCRQLAHTGPDAAARLPLAEGELRQWRDGLHRLPATPPPALTPVFWTGEHPLPWAGGQLRREPRPGEGIAPQLWPPGGLLCRPRQGGENFQLPGRPRRPLKKILQESAIPPWTRPQLPLLWLGDQLLWCGDIGEQAEARCPAGEVGWVVTWERGR